MHGVGVLAWSGGVCTYLCMVPRTMKSEVKGFTGAAPVAPVSAPGNDDDDDDGGGLR